MTDPCPEEHQNLAISNEDLLFAAIGFGIAAVGIGLFLATGGGAVALVVAAGGFAIGSISFGIALSRNLAAHEAHRENCKIEQEENLGEAEARQEFIQQASFNPGDENGESVGSIPFEEVDDFYLGSDSGLENWSTTAADIINGEPGTIIRIPGFPGEGDFIITATTQDPARVQQIINWALANRDYLRVIAEAEVTIEDYQLDSDDGDSGDFGYSDYGGSDAFAFNISSGRSGLVGTATITDVGPVILDLDGDGLELLPLSAGIRKFDVDDDGYIESMGWVAPDDGILVYDQENDGDVTAPEEFVFTGYVTGAETDLEGLAYFDTNDDDKLTSADTDWAKFKVWKDADSDGEVDTGELLSLASYSITEIDLTSSTTDSPVVERNTVFGESTATRSSGGPLDVFDVGFRTATLGIKSVVLSSSANTIMFEGIDTSILEWVSASALTFDVGSSNHSGLSQFGGVIGGASNDTLSTSQDDGSGLAGAGGNDSLSGGDGNDTLDGGPGNDSLDGGAGNDVLFYDSSDGIISGGSGYDTLVASDDGGVSINLATSGVEVVVAGVGDDSLSYSGSEDVVLYGAGGTDTLSSGDGADRIEGEDGNDDINSGLGDDIVAGGAGNDTIDTSTGDDILSGGTGADVLSGGTGNDTYIFERGDGSDDVTDTGGTTDVIYFGFDVEPEHLLIEVSGADLIIGIIDPASSGTAFASLADKITINDWTTAANKIETFSFASNGFQLDTSTIATWSHGDNGADTLSGSSGVHWLSGGAGADSITVDGTIGTNAANSYLFGGHDHDLLLADDYATGSTLVGGAGHDTLRGYSGDNILIGGLGDDTLQLGDSGGNTIIYRAGEGQDKLYATDGTDNVIFTDLDPEDLTIEKTGDVLEIAVIDPDNPDDAASTIADRLRTPDFFATGNAHDITFGNGLKLENLGHVDAGGSGADSLTGSSTLVNWIFGGTGNDTIDGGDDYDLLIGGDGVDSISGDLGSDTIWGGGSVDKLYGNAGDDLAFGGDGDDSLWGGNDDDSLYGDAGDDVLVGEAGDDDLITGSGEDTLKGKAGGDNYIISSDNYKATIQDDGDTDFLIIDQLTLLAESDPLNLRITRTTSDYLEIDSVLGNVDVTVVSQFIDGTQHIEELQLSDGAIYAIRNLATGGTGNDLLVGDGGGVTLSGGDGNDLLYDGSGVDSVQGQSGDDILIGGNGGDTLSGGSGNDTLLALTGQNALYGGNDNDTFLIFEDTGSTTTVSDGGGSDDLIVFSDIASAEDIAFSRDGNYLDITNLDDDYGVQVYLFYSTSDPLFHVELLELGNGTSYNLDQDLSGGAENDVVVGTSSAETLTGLAGDDILWAGISADSIVGGDGNDAIYGENGDDTISGSNDNDFLNGGAGSDEIFGGAGFDEIYGDNGNDDINGNGEDDIIVAGAGQDTVFGGDDNDVIYGENGNDDLSGGTGNDFIDGGIHADTIDGGWGVDTLTGGDGSDTFVFGQGDDVDVIEDFVAGASSDDIIDLSGMGTSFDTFSEVTAAASDVGDDVLIDFGNGDQIYIKGVQVADLHQDDFIFT